MNPDRFHSQDLCDQLNFRLNPIQLQVAVGPTYMNSDLFELRRPLLVRSAESGSEFRKVMTWSPEYAEDMRALLGERTEEMLLDWVIWRIQKAFPWHFDTKPSSAFFFEPLVAEMHECVKHTLISYFADSNMHQMAVGTEAHKRIALLCINAAADFFELFAKSRYAPGMPRIVLHKLEQPCGMLFCDLGDGMCKYALLAEPYKIPVPDLEYAPPATLARYCFDQVMKLILERSYMGSTGAKGKARFVVFAPYALPIPTPPILDPKHFSVHRAWRARMAIYPLA